MTLRFSISLLCGVGLAATLSAAHADPLPSAAVPITFAFEEIVALTPTEIMGETPLGARQRVPITGGTFSGPNLSGTIVPGGWDWQLRRADGSLVIEADYFIETDDHIRIHVHNQGVVYQDKAKGTVYRWTEPQFEAPMGKYGWLNDAVFVSSLNTAGDRDHPAVRVTIYKVG